MFKKKRMIESQKKINEKDLENSSIKQNIISIENKTIEIPKEKNIKDNFKKNSLFIRKNSKNKKFFINKEKLFNQKISHTNASNEENLNNYEKESKLTKEKRLNKEILKNSIGNCHIPYNKKEKKKITRNNIIIQKINNFYGPIYQKNYDDTIQSYKEEIKEENYSYLNRKKIRKNYCSFRTSEIKNDFTSDNCCISCT